MQDEKEVLQNKVDELTRELNDAKGDLMVRRRRREEEMWEVLVCQIRSFAKNDIELV